MDKWHEKVEPEMQKMFDVKGYMLTNETWSDKGGVMVKESGVGDDVNTFAEVTLAYEEIMAALSRGQTNDDYKSLVDDYKSLVDDYKSLVDSGKAAHGRLLKAKSLLVPYFNAEALYEKAQAKERSIDAWAHWGELVRLYVSRICVTVTIAAVIFYMYWLADCMNIALPAKFMK